MLTPTEFGVRLLETLVSGLCYSVWALIVVYALTRKGTESRGKLVLFFVCFSCMTLGSFATHYGILTQHMKDIAYGQAPSVFAKLILTVMSVATAPEIVQAWNMYHKAKRLTKSSLDCFDLTFRVKQLFVRRNGATTAENG